MADTEANGASRFQVARASVEFVDVARSSSEDGPHPGDAAGSLAALGPRSSTGGHYETRYLRSLRHYLTRDALPRETHYRNLGSIAENQMRPTLEQLRAETHFTTADAEDSEAKTGHELKGKVVKFGWIDGVYMRCLLNIWGVMLFLRLTWVVGQAGLIEALGLIFLANLVTIITSISMSAVATNGQIKGGGIYYMISRSLGPEFGASIGLLFTMSNAVSCAMYVVGFCESMNAMLKEYGVHYIVDGKVNDVRIVGSVTMVMILLLALVGMDWVTRVQALLLVLLVAAQVNFIAGSFMGPDSQEEIAKGFSGLSVELLKENLWSDYRPFKGNEYDFFSVFGIFFPAVTGIVAGANLSGDLKDPASAIPKGTLLAILTTFVTYMLYPVLIAAGTVRQATGSITDLNTSISMYNICTADGTNITCAYGTQLNDQVMGLMSAWAPLIYAGTFAATLSSAIASLVGAPRVFQALAKDKLYPYLSVFARGMGANNDPIFGYALVFVVALCCVLIGELNAIANLSSEVFLAAYALINLSCFHASFLNSPGWRPTFKYYNSWVSLVGAFACLAVMFLSDPIVATVVLLATLLLYLYVLYRKPDVNWGSSTQAQIYSSALTFMQRLSRVKEHVKTYRPQLLVLSAMPATRPVLVDFAHAITKSSSLLITAQVYKGSASMRTRSALNQQANSWLSRQEIRGFYAVTEDQDFGRGALSLMQLAGLGNLQPNVVLMGYKADWSSCPRHELLQYFQCIQGALNNNLAVAVLRIPGGLDASGILTEEDTLSPLSCSPLSTEPIELQTANTSLSPVNEEKSLELTESGIGDVSASDESAPDSPQITRDQSQTGTGAPDTTTDKKLKSAFSKLKRNKKQEMHFANINGELVDPALADRLLLFRRKQTGTIDVWWLYDDGGLTLLLPYILSTRSQWSGCKLRVFTLANRRDELDTEKRSMAALISKFRIDYSDVIVIDDVHKPAQNSTSEEFERMIKDFRVSDDNVETDGKEVCITDCELLANKEKTNRQLGLHEKVQQHSKDASLVIMTLPVPRNGVTHAPLFMAWMDIVSKNMPPFLLLRGNQNSVLTFYS